MSVLLFLQFLTMLIVPFALIVFALNHYERTAEAYCCEKKWLNITVT